MCQSDDFDFDFGFDFDSDDESEEEEGNYLTDLAAIDESQMGQIPFIDMLHNFYQFLAFIAVVICLVHSNIRK